MNPSAYGCPEGQLAFYFHGVPGAPVEAQMLHPAALAHSIRLQVVERNLPGNPGSEAYLNALAQQISTAAAGQPIRLIGFSIGACLALRVAARLGDRVTAVYLLSAAAPLQEPNNCVGMGAGRYTFLWAQRYRRLFLAFAWYQALLAKISPRLLLNLLFAGAGGKDPKLLRQADPQAWLANIQRACFKHGTSGYVRDVTLYVEPWAAELAKVTAAVSLWHGEADNWAPLAMSVYLQRNLANVRSFTHCAGQAHYGCLLDNAHAVMASVQRDALSTQPRTAP